MACCSVLVRVGILLVLVCLVLSVTLPGTDARRSRRSSHRHANVGGPTTSQSRGFTYYFVIVVIIFGGILVFVCCLLNSLRCVEKVLSKRSKKRALRRRTHEGGAADGDQPVGYQRDAVDQSELMPPPSYADVISEATAPPPSYSDLYVGDAGWN